MKIQEIMTAHARCVPPEATLVEAARQMLELDIGSLPVCENDRIIGMITDRDITIRAVATGLDPKHTMVRETMVAGVTYIFQDQDVEDAAELMETKQIRRLPVLNREKRLVGIISLGDIALHAQPSLTGHALKEVSETAHAA